MSEGPYPKISVVLPVYNGGRAVGRAIQCVLKQEYPAHQIIVVDDGSTDETPQVLAAFGEKIIVRRIPNSGVSVARNVGMKLVTGDFIAFLDHDDFFFKNKLTRMAEKIRQFPSAGFFCSDYAVRYESKKNRMIKHYSILGNARELNFDSILKKPPFELLLKEHFVGTASAVVLKKEIAEKVGGFDPAHRVSQDFDYWLRCAVHTPFVILSEVLFYKKNRLTSLSGSTLAMWTSHRKVLKENAEVQERRAGSPRVRALADRAVADTEYLLGNYWFETGDARRAFETYRAALAVYPAAGNFLRYAFTVFKKTVRMVLRKR